MKNCWAWNNYYFCCVNACDNSVMVGFFEMVLTACTNAFRRKRYFWNWFRGKTFYINAARYVIENVREVMNGTAENPDDNMHKAEKLIKELLATEKNEKVRKSFIWNIGKAVPLLTIDTIQYLSTERIANILNSSDHVFNDHYVEPFIRTIRDLRQENDDLRDTINEID